MIRRRPRGEPSLSKATYDHKKPRFDPPCPTRVKAADELIAAECAQDRANDKRIKVVGLAEVLGITRPKQPINRRF
jgi:hypothetical protein